MYSLMDQRVNIGDEENLVRREDRELGCKYKTKKPVQKPSQESPAFKTMYNLLTTKCVFHLSFFLIIIIIIIYMHFNCAKSKISIVLNILVNRALLTRLFTGSFRSFTEGDPSYTLPFHWIQAS